MVCSFWLMTSWVGVGTLLLLMLQHHPYIDSECQGYIGCALNQTAVLDLDDLAPAGELRSQSPMMVDLQQYL
jgi:hypothetical protein